MRGMYLYTALMISVSGNGEAYRSLDLGRPDWSAYQVIDDSIQWKNVYPGVDFKVRYVHDILKVDVILDQSFRDILRAERLEWRNLQ